MGSLKVSLPCFAAAEAETHAEKDAYEPQTHSYNDARHCMDVQLCRQSHIRGKPTISHATNNGNMEIPERQRFPDMTSCQLYSTCVFYVFNMWMYL